MTNETNNLAYCDSCRAHVPENELNSMKNHDAVKICNNCLKGLEDSVHKNILDRNKKLTQDADLVLRSLKSLREQGIIIGETINEAVYGYPFPEEKPAEVQQQQVAPQQ